jgi:hypothetical protein
VRDTGSNAYLHNYYEYQLHPFVNDTIDFGVTPGALNTEAITPFLDYSLAGSWTGNNVAPLAVNTTSFSLPELMPDSPVLQTLVQTTVGSHDDVSRRPIDKMDERPLAQTERIRHVGDIVSFGDAVGGEGEILRSKRQKARAEKLERTMALPPQAVAAREGDGDPPALPTTRRNLRSFHARHINKHHELTSLPAIPIRSNVDYFIYVVIFLQALSGIVSLSCTNELFCVVAIIIACF